MKWSRFKKTSLYKLEERAIPLYSVSLPERMSLYRLSGGAIGGRMGKSPVLLLRTTGRKSGKQYTTPVLYLADSAHWVVVASYAGSPAHPTWWLNLKAHTRARVQVGRQNVSVTAIQAPPDERARLWPLLIEMYPQY